MQPFIPNLNSWASKAPISISFFVSNPISSRAWSFYQNTQNEAQSIFGTEAQGSKLFDRFRFKSKEIKKNLTQSMEVAKNFRFEAQKLLKDSDLEHESC